MLENSCSWDVVYSVEETTWNMATHFFLENNLDQYIFALCTEIFAGEDIQVTVHFLRITCQQIMSTNTTSLSSCWLSALQEVLQIHHTVLFLIHCARDSFLLTPKAWVQRTPDLWVTKNMPFRDTYSSLQVITQKK